MNVQCVCVWMRVCAWILRFVCRGNIKHQLTHLLCSLCVCMCVCVNLCESQYPCVYVYTVWSLIKAKMTVCLILYDDLLWCACAYVRYYVHAWHVCVCLSVCPGCMRCVHIVILCCICVVWLIAAESEPYLMCCKWDSLSHLLTSHVNSTNCIYVRQ